MAENEPQTGDASVVDKAADLSTDVLTSLEEGQHAVLKAVRQFLDTVDEAIPAIGDRPTRREAVIDSALGMVDTLVTTQYDFLRKVVNSAGSALSKDDTTE